jgi:hypothetical protein
MLARAASKVRIAAKYQPILRELGIDGDAVFDHELIKPWRTISDRQNCVLETTLRDGRSLRWHIKRYARVLAGRTPAEYEVGGHELLLASDIPTYVLVGWGVMEDRRSFVVIEDLAGFRPADKLLEQGLEFARLLEPTADLAARFHDAGLHHRDLYLCHFMARPASHPVELRLIDTARIRRIPRLFAGRWVVKDLAQFWYSTLSQPITEHQRLAWLHRYAAASKIGGIDGLVRKIRRRINWMARHDVELNRKQPNRNISIPRH